jgi:hypothetical protein
VSDNKKEFVEDKELYIELDIQPIELEEFMKSRMWAIIENEIKLRDKVITEDLRNGDNSLGDDNNKRGRLKELEFVLTIPQAVLADIRISQKDKINKEEVKDGGRD